MFTTHVHKLAAAALFFFIASTVISGSFTKTSIFGISFSGIVLPSYSWSVVMNASTLPIIFLARSHFRCCLYSCSSKMRQQAVTFSTPAGGFGRDLSSPSMFLVKQATASAAACMAGSASASSASADVLTSRAAADATPAFSASILAAAPSFSAMFREMPISMMSASVALFFSSTMTMVLSRSILSSATSVDVFFKVERPTSNRSICRWMSWRFSPKTYL
mmetsp:Transcript_7546/g.21055  ORF Transcript_7546/g.21055 Transcript_7546/m.21055 type:complete len:220 (+) Transcript_7546:3759-4418(+)